MRTANSLECSVAASETRLRAVPAYLMRGLFAAASMTALLVAGCGRPEPIASAPPRTPPTVVSTGWFRGEHVGAPVEGKPWISHVSIVDLDRDGRADILACDDKLNGLVWLRQVSPGRFTESTIASELSGLVHVEAVDMDGDGDLDLLVACMGELFPNNDKIGSVIILENDGAQRFTRHVIAANVARVTDLRAGDFNGDGRLDLAVGQFGYDQGEIQWMENIGPWEFRSHNLLNLSGTINVCVADMNGDGTLDIVALVSQQWEEIHLFENDGRGNFRNKILFGSTNEDYGSSGISLCDVNRDGRPDILYANGDGFAYADPGQRPWHGLQWLENRGNGYFRFHRIANLPGAYSPIGVDLNGDGAMDILCTSGFNDWTKPHAVSIMAYLNDGRENFTAHVLAYEPTQVISIAAGDLDGSGRVSFVTGGFYSYPPFDRMSRIMVWTEAEK